MLSAAASKERSVFNLPASKPLASAYDRQVEGMGACAWEVGSA